MKFNVVHQFFCLKSSFAYSHAINQICRSFPLNKKKNRLILLFNLEALNRQTKNIYQNFVKLFQLLSAFFAMVVLAATVTPSPVPGTDYTRLVSYLELSLPRFP